MRKLLTILAAVTLLNLAGTPAFAEDPAVNAQPDVRTDGSSPSAGGSASADGGSLGPANFQSTEPVATSSSTTAPQDQGAHGTTTASAPGTRASAPIGAQTAEPNPQAPDGSTPEPTTSRPTTNADSTGTSASFDGSRARATTRTTATGAFGGSVAGIGSFQDPTFASTCMNGEAEPGTPTDASLGTMCGGEPSGVEEDFSASEANGNGTGGNPGASSCMGATASAGTSPSAGLTPGCATTAATSPDSSGTSPDDSPGTSATGGGSAGPGATAQTREAARESANVGVLGLMGLPSTATSSGFVLWLGVTFALIGLLLIIRTRVSVARAD